MHKPTLRQLEYLIALDTAGSFSVAAENCFVTQSTLSAGIKELEDILGQPLVQRGRKTNPLTPLGHKVCEHGKAIFAEVEQILTQSKALSEPLSGPLRLGVIPTIAPYLLPRLLPALQKQYPALELRLHEDLTERLIAQLHQGRLDAVLMAFPYDTPALTQSILFKEDFLVACPKSQPHPQTFTMADLGSEKLLLLEDGHCLRDHALSACKIQLPRQRKTFSATSLPTLIQMVAGGYGITLLPEMAAKADTVPASLALVPFENPKPGREIGLCWNRNSPRQRDFILLGQCVKELQKR
jgi:LysR family hydrogen peroxide-inducible transcriptional activator